MNINQLDTSSSPAINPVHCDAKGANSSKKDAFEQPELASSSGR